AVAGEFRRRDRGADVIDLIAGGEWAVEWNADHCADAGLFAIAKSEPPAGKEKPPLIIARSAARTLSNTALRGRLISSSFHSWKSRLLFLFIREQIINGRSSETKEVIRWIWNPARSTFLRSSARL